MSTPSVRFNRKDRPEFYKALNTRVNAYFKDNNISKHADANMKFKTAFMLALYLVPLAAICLGWVSGVWPVMGMWAIMGFGMSGIGLSVMHDANHRSYSSNPTVNKVVGSVINLVGGYPANWRMQHNVLHHSFTNIEHHDEDFDTPALRCTPNQERKYLHRFQAFYASFLYGLMTIYWYVGKDFVQIVKYNKMGLLAGQNLTYRKAMIQIVLLKIFYGGVFIALPMITSDVLWWQSLLGWGLMQYISGIILALVFQPAHVIEETQFYEVDETGSVENHWAIHQLKTTSNFAKKNRVLSWYVGGLNYQVEHHLFPSICHVHYRNIAPIVKATALEYGIPYYEHPTFYAALRSHFSLLHRLGTGIYDKEEKEQALAV
jgi:linoleoyl-CoA desaturase